MYEVKVAIFYALKIKEHHPLPLGGLHPIIIYTNIVFF